MEKWGKSLWIRGREEKKKNKKDRDGQERDAQSKEGLNDEENLNIIYGLSAIHSTQEKLNDIYNKWFLQL